MKYILLLMAFIGVEILHAQIESPPYSPNLDSIIAVKKKLYDAVKVRLKAIEKDLRTFQSFSGVRDTSLDGHTYNLDSLKKIQRWFNGMGSCIKVISENLNVEDNISTPEKRPRVLIFQPDGSLKITRDNDVGTTCLPIEAESEFTLTCSCPRFEWVFTNTEWTLYDANHKVVDIQADGIVYVSNYKPIPEQGLFIDSSIFKCDGKKLYEIRIFYNRKQVLYVSQWVYPTGVKPDIVIDTKYKL